MDLFRVEDDKGRVFKSNKNLFSGFYLEEDSAKRACVQARSMYRYRGGDWRVVRYKAEKA